MLFYFILQVHRPSMWIMNKNVQLIKGKKEEKVLFYTLFSSPEPKAQGELL